MQKNINEKIKNLQARATQRKLSCPATKAQNDVQKEKEYFEYLKEKLYNQIGR